MPKYAYACKDCSHAFDIQQSFTDDSLTVCPECRGTLRKKFNSVGVVFKGSGFYRTDSRAASNSVPAAASGDQSNTPKASPATADSSGSATGSSSSGSSTSGSSGSGNSGTRSTSAKSPAPAGASN